MKLLYAVMYIILLLLTGCVTTIDQERIKNYTKLTSIIFVDQPTVPNQQGELIKVGGHSSWSKDAARIVLKKSEGMTCILHELKHVIEEWKHGPEANRELCYD
jgi:hypothetical protein